MTDEATDYTKGTWVPRPDQPGLYLCTWEEEDGEPCGDPMAYPISEADDADDEWDGHALCLDHLVSIDLDVGEADLDYVDDRKDET